MSPGAESLQAVVADRQKRRQMSSDEIWKRRCRKEKNTEGETPLGCYGELFISSIRTVRSGWSPGNREGAGSLLKSVFEIRFEDFRQFHGPVFLLVVFQDGDDGPANGQAGAVERMDELALLLSFRAIPD